MSSLHSQNTKASFKAPPPTNRGAQITKGASEGTEFAERPYSYSHGYTPEIGIDYITFSTSAETQLVLDYLGAMLEGQFQREEMGTRFYKARWSGPFGASVKAQPKMGWQHTNVNLPGDACAKLGFENLVNLTCVFEARLSRLDPKIDHCPFTPHVVHDAFMSGDCNTHVQRRKGSIRFFFGLEEHSYKFDELPELDSTCYLGSVNSDTMARCYDMRRTSEGYRITRFELQLRRRRANDAWWLLVNPQSDNVVEDAKASLASWTIGLVTGHADFVDRESDINISRCERLDWWAQLVEDVERLRLAIPKLEPTIEKACEWVRTMSGAFSTFACATLASRGKLMLYTDEEGKVQLDHNWYPDARLILADLLYSGLNRMKGKHWALVQSVTPGMVL